MAQRTTPDQLDPADWLLMIRIALDHQAAGLSTPTEALDVIASNVDAWRAEVEAAR